MRNLSLFSINGTYGSGAYGQPEFPAPQDVLDHLDYLGIARCLVWQEGARAVNPTWGNRRLIAELEALPEAADRLIPALVIAPPTFYETDGITSLVELLEAGHTRAIRIFPGTSRFRMREIERVLHDIASYEPTIFWDFRDTNGPADLTDLVDLAKRYPQVHFVCTQLMWQQLGAVLDLMWRCDNILIDTSWLHVRNGIELLVEQFGAERVLFGIGPKAHYGAAIGDLVHARISDEERQLIAHGNIERLLGLPPASREPSPHPLLEQKPLWCRHLRGEALTEQRIIDPHGHTPPHTRSWCLPDTDVESGLPHLIDQMDRLGVERTIVSPEPALFGHPLHGSREAEPILARYADRFSAYLVFNPYFGDELQPHLDGFFDRGVYVGLKVLPDYWQIPVTDPGYEPVWQIAHRRRLPILLHTWQGPFNSPAMLTDIATRHPNAIFLCGHSGGGDKGRREAEALARQTSNVYLEFCGSFTSTIPWQDTVAAVGNDRVLFGSDTTAHSVAWELARYLSTPIPDDELIPGLGTTMRHILEASETPFPQPPKHD